MNIRSSSVHVLMSFFLKFFIFFFVYSCMRSLRTDLTSLSVNWPLFIVPVCTMELSLRICGRTLSTKVVNDYLIAALILSLF